MIRRAEPQSIFLHLPLFLLVAACSGIPALHAQTADGSALPPQALEPIFVAVSGDAGEWGSADDATGGDKNDPEYREYQDAYKLIFDEKWSAARSKLDAFAKNHPKSKYLDDATYWSAYALMHVDRDAASQAYVSFISHFPSSPYFDDAVADLTDLRAGHPVIIQRTMNGRNMSISVTTGGRMGGDDSAMTVVSGGVTHAPGPMTIKAHPGAKGGIGYSYSYTAPGPEVKALEKALTRMKMPRVWAPMAPVIDPDQLDQPTRLRIEALRALSRTKHDTGSFRVLGEVAGDRSNPLPLRLTAMEELTQVPGSDPLPVLLQIAKADTVEEIQDYAVDQIGMLQSDQNRCVESLIELFNAIPQSRSGRRESVFFSIAEIGNDRAVDFLAKVAQKDQDYDLRNQAIFYLGNIGTPKAREALTAILRQK